MAVKIVIEPIFEADFEDCSFGFRPKRDAHQAVGVIREALNDGCPYVLDADLQQYFDTIVHEKLMKLIAGRISDRHILDGSSSGLERQWWKRTKKGSGGQSRPSAARLRGE